MYNTFFYLFKRYRIHIWLFLFILFCLIWLSLKSPKTLSHNWRLRPTEHFLIYYEKNSPAQKDIETLAGLLEEYFKETAQMFNIKIDKRIPYYFHSSGLSFSNKTLWGYATKEDIHVIYSDSQKDSSPHELRHFIHQRINPKAPYFFNEGACGLGIQIAGVGFHARASQICSDLAKYSLLELVKDFQRYGRLGDYLAYSFNSFLIGKYSKEKFAQFYKKLTRDNWPGLIKEVYGLSFLEAEAKWKDFLCH